MLGAAQWAWLEQEINDPTPEIFLITSGIKIISDDRLIYEGWISEEKEKLYKLIGKY